MYWLFAIAIIFFVWAFIRNVTSVSDFKGWVWRGNEKLRVLHKFIRCESKQDAYDKSKAKGMGAEPDFHEPHRPGNPDHYYHFHPGNHELCYEDREWVNYHFIFEDDSI